MALSGGDYFHSRIRQVAQSDPTVLKNEKTMSFTLRFLAGSTMNTSID